MRRPTQSRPQRATVILAAVAISLAAALAIVSHAKARNDAGTTFLDWNTIRTVV
ncbi:MULTISPECIES: hypothetical protein [Methylobacterium]|uniref:hypothetical protein n=1 Tax=Methylobacterium TaxID=407 RepID=UPI001404ADE2|nr:MULTISPECIES: hypothetical protein [Methylobacterium]MDR7035832.1 hypothetical protein [Methylobacterium sp. BE186]